MKMSRGNELLPQDKPLVTATLPPRVSDRATHKSLLQGLERWLRRAPAAFHFPVPASGSSPVTPAPENPTSPARSHGLKSPNATLN